jgi:HEAT repeat protein
LKQQSAAQAVPLVGRCDATCWSPLWRRAGAFGEPAVPPDRVRGAALPFQIPSPHARREAARSLAAIGDPRAVPALYEVLEDDSALLVYWAEQGLERMGVGMAFFKP